jgi:hypothetical protein
MRKILMLGIAAAVVLTACSDSQKLDKAAGTVVGTTVAVPPPTSSPPAPTTVTFIGDITLGGAHSYPAEWASANNQINDGCSGLGGYADFQPGAQVVIKDATGAIVGTTNLLYASVQPDYSTVAGGVHPGQVCVAEFKKITVAASDFYSVSLGTRPPAVVQKAELPVGVHLSLG